MEKTNIFEEASRLKLKFPTAKGFIGVEDLWDIPMSVLNSMYSDLKKTEDSEDKYSLESPKTTTNERLKLSLLIIVHVYSVRKDEAEAKQKSLIVAAEKKKLRELIERKKEEAMDGKSLQELEEILKSMD